MSAVRRLRTRENGRNRRSRSPSAIPIPWSLTLTTARSSSRRISSCTVPPPGEYLTAFEIRLSSTSASRSRSAQAGTGSSGISATRVWLVARGHAAHDLARHRGHVDDPEVERELARLQAVRLEGLLHEVRHVGGGVDDRARLLQAVRARRVRPPLQQLGVAEHAGQGRAEVVGHDVHELALHAVELDELGVRCARGPGTARRCAA